MSFASLLGMFDGLNNTIADLGNSIIYSGLLKFIGVVLYGLSYALFLVIDFLNMFFRRIVGLESGVMFNGKEIQGDIVVSLIQSKEVWNVFLALLLVAVFLLLISTIVAIIKSEYNFDKGGNAKGPIFGRAIKALFYFLSVPTICIFGVFMANQLLIVLDQATSQKTSTSISSLVFASCCQKANRVRNDDSFWNGYRQIPSISGGKGSSGAFFYIRATASSGIIEDNNINRNGIAEGIDQAFANESFTSQPTDPTLANTRGVVTNGSSNYASTFEFKYFYGDFGRPNIGNDELSRSSFKTHYGLSINNIKETNSTFSVYNMNLVWFYYDLLSYDHLISLLASFLILKALFDLCMGVTKRIYEMIVLFCVSPPIVALMPLDEGAAYKNWTKAFVGKTLAAYGGVLAMNFFFMLVPVMRNLNVFGSGSIMLGSIDMTFVFNYLAQLVMIIAGAISLTSISSMISGLIGADDVLKDGSETGKAVLGGFGKAAAFAIGAGGLIGGGLKAAVNLPKKALNAGQQLGKDIKGIAAGEDRAEGVSATTSEIASEVGSTPTPDASSAVGSGGGDTTPPGDGGPGGAPTGGGGGDPTPGPSPAPTGTPVGGGSTGGGETTPASTSASAGGGSSTSSEKPKDDRPIGDKLYSAIGAGARKVGAHISSATTGKGVAEAAKQTKKATSEKWKDAKREFSYMSKNSSFSTNAYHFAAGVVGTAKTGLKAVAGGLKTAGRAVGMGARMGGAVIKNFALPAVKSVARGLGAVGGLVANAVTGGEWSNSVTKPFAEHEKQKKDQKTKAEQKSLHKQLEKEVDALDKKYGENVGSIAYNSELQSIMSKYKIKGLDI